MIGLIKNYLLDYFNKNYFFQRGERKSLKKYHGKINYIEKLVKM